MVDITAITSILTGLKTATDIAVLLKGSGISLEKAEYKLKLAELISVLADAKIELAEIQQLVMEKEKLIRELQEALEIKETLTWEQPYYWLVDGNNKDGPFCQQCYDNDRKLARLQGNGNGYWECKTCKNSYKDKTYTSPAPMVVSSRRDFDSYI